MLHLLFQLVFFVISWILFLEAPKTPNKLFTIYCLLLAFSSIFCAYCLKEKNRDLTGQSLRHSFLFIISYCIVVYQYNIDFLLDLNIPNNSSLIWYDVSIVSKALSLSTSALIAFMLGYTWIKNRYHCRKLACNAINFRPSKIKLLYKITVILIIMYLIFVNKAYLFGGYNKAGIDQGPIAKVIYGILQPCILVLILVFSYSYKKVNHKICSWSYLFYVRKILLLAAFFVLLILMSGRRTEAVKIITICLVSFLYATSIKFRPLFVASSIFFVSILMSIFAIYRIARLTNDDRNISDNIATLKNGLTISPGTQELAFNVSSLHIAMSHIPKKYDYNLGISFFSGAALLVPGLNSILKSNTKSNVVLKSDYFITELGLGDLKWGLGTSCIADTYISFGPFISCIIFFFWGILLRKLEDSTFSSNASNPYWLAFSFLVYGSLIYSARSSFFSCIEGLTYTFIILFLQIRKIKI